MQHDDARSVLENDPRERSLRGNLAVAMLSKSNRQGGGASAIAEDLARLLNEAGCKAEHWFMHGGCPSHPYQKHLLGPRLNRIQARIERAERRFGVPDLLPWEYLLLAGPLKRFDVVHFHDITLSYSNYTLRWIARRQPTVWTFHDCSPFTGGCTVPLGCRAYEHRCGNCPFLELWPFGGRMRWDRTGLLQDIKRQTAAEGNFLAVAPSNWMADQAFRSNMFAQRPRVIPNWVDSATFQPRDRAALRAELGLEPQRDWVLISSGCLADWRKGVGHAIEAVRRCDRPVGVLCVGAADAQIADQLPGRPVVSTGFVSDQSQLARWYAAADALLFPSLGDNLPSTVLEAMACGLPTIGFRVGGVPELVRHEDNGYLVDSEDVAGLVQGLQLIVDRPDLRRRWGDAGRRITLERHGRAAFVSAYREVYDEAIAARRTAPRRRWLRAA